MSSHSGHAPRRREQPHRRQRSSEPTPVPVRSTSEPPPLWRHNCRSVAVEEAWLHAAIASHKTVRRGPGGRDRLRTPANRRLRDREQNADYDGASGRHNCPYALAGSPFDGASFTRAPGCASMGSMFGHRDRRGREVHRACRTRLVERALGVRHGRGRDRTVDQQGHRGAITPLLAGTRIGRLSSSTRTSGAPTPTVVRQLAEEGEERAVFLCGSIGNGHEVWGLFEKVFLLSIDEATMRHRLLTRTAHDFGRRPHELELLPRVAHGDRRGTIAAAARS